MSREYPWIPININQTTLQETVKKKNFLAGNESTTDQHRRGVHLQPLPAPANHTLCPPRLAQVLYVPRIGVQLPGLWFLYESVGQSKTVNTQ